jgi:AhpD family alkylhydroperoxidase
MQTKYFNKRFYTPGALLTDLVELLSYAPSILATIRSRRISREFAEKIMLVVTQVNECRYCWYGHTRLALRSGVDADEIRNIMLGNLQGFSQEQSLALAYAQHYAETCRRPDDEAEQQFKETYGSLSQDILNYIRMITIGNLAGNTADAFLSRLQGRPAKNSSIWKELILFLLFAPILLPLLVWMNRSKLPQAGL